MDGSALQELTAEAPNGVLRKTVYIWIAPFKKVRAWLAEEILHALCKEEGQHRREGKPKQPGE